jgi:alpha-beta hydrolase superfamily lysophospholipase
MRIGVVFALFLTFVSSITGQTAPAASPQTGASAQEVTLETATGKLYGTLLLPAGNRPFPVVLIVAGSGMTDRDGNTVGTRARSDALKLLAEGLAANGIASLRYDKRSVAKSAAARLPTNKFETQFDDAAQWIGLLAKDPRFRAIGVIGHSEGALVAALAAQRGSVKALVYLAGPGRHFDEVMTEQFDRAAQNGQMPKSAAIALRAAVAEWRAGRTIKDRPKDIPQELGGLFNPRAQEYVISIVAYDPIAEVTKLHDKGVQIMVLQGTADLTGRTDEPTMVATAVGAKPVLIEGMSHELKLAPMDQAGNDKANSDPRIPIAPELIRQLAPFLLNALK